MTHIELHIGENYYKNISQIKHIYDKITNDIMEKEGVIEYNKFNFNNYIGDVTKGIRWTWAVNPSSLELFTDCITGTEHTINDFFRNEFKVFGASFITLYEKEIVDSEFHLDINSHYDKPTITNTLTLLFPLYIEDDMGGLEYKESGEIKLYKYNKNKMFIWDACKLYHRTQPYKLQNKKKRVLVSLNLVSNEQWAIESVNSSLNYQGNLGN